MTTEDEAEAGELRFPTPVFDQLWREHQAGLAWLWTHATEALQRDEVLGRFEVAYGRPLTVNRTVYLSEKQVNG